MTTVMLAVTLWVIASSVDNGAGGSSMSKDFLVPEHLGHMSEMRVLNTTPTMEVVGAWTRTGIF